MNIIKRAYISSDGVYRYWLTREWFQPGKHIKWVCFIGLNPSTADAEIDDPTIRREISFAIAVGANALVKVNMYAYRATKPSDLEKFWTMRGSEAAQGHQNAAYVRDAVNAARHGCNGRGVFAAWGAVPKKLDRTNELVALIGKPIMCLGTTKHGAPRHPLYLPKTACPQEWRCE